MLQLQYVDGTVISDIGPRQKRVDLPTDPPSNVSPPEAGWTDGVHQIVEVPDPPPPPPPPPPTDEQLDEEEMQKMEMGSIDRAFTLELHDHENRIRTLEGRPLVSQSNYVDHIRQQLRGNGNGAAGQAAGQGAK